MKRLAFAALLLVLTACWGPDEQRIAERYYGTVGEQRAYGLINGSRLERNLRAVAWSDALGRCAHAQVRRIIAYNNSRNTTGHVRHSTRACENRETTETVGPGPHPNAIHAAFLDSTDHRPAVMGRFRFAGTGIGRDERGTYYAVYQFWR